MTQADLGVASGYADHTQIARIESGVSQPRMPRLKMIARALGVEASALLSPARQEVGRTGAVEGLAADIGFFRRISRIAKTIPVSLSDKEFAGVVYVLTKDGANVSDITDQDIRRILEQAEVFLDK